MIINMTGGGKPELQAKTITPSTSNVVVTPDSGYDGLSQVTVNGDPELVAGNIKDGVNIFGIVGTYAGEAPQLYLNAGLNNTITGSVSVGGDSTGGYSVEAAVSSPGAATCVIGGGIIQTIASTYRTSGGQGSSGLRRYINVSITPVSGSITDLLKYACPEGKSFSATVNTWVLLNLATSGASYASTITVAGDVTFNCRGNSDTVQWTASNYTGYTSRSDFEYINTTTSRVYLKSISSYTIT